MLPISSDFDTNIKPIWAVKWYTETGVELKCKVQTDVDGNLTEMVIQINWKRLVKSMPKWRWQTQLTECVLFCFVFIELLVHKNGRSFFGVRLEMNPLDYLKNISVFPMSISNKMAAVSRRERYSNIHRKNLPEFMAGKIHFQCIRLHLQHNKFVL